MLYLFYTQRMATRATDNINHEAHLFGALGGMLLTVLLHPSVVPDFIGEMLSLVS